MMARSTLERMADAIEEAASADGPMKVPIFMVAKTLGLTLKDMNATALHSTGPWGGLSMMAQLVIGIDNVPSEELMALVDAAWLPGAFHRGNARAGGHWKP